MKKFYVIALLVAAAAWAFGAPQSHTGVKVHAAASPANALPQMPTFHFDNFTTANGLPDNHVFSVLVDGDRVWAGTENGLALYENHAWKTYTTADGLAHRAVLSLALDKRTGDLWAGTMGGLSRVSGGRIDTLDWGEFLALAVVQLAADEHPSRFVCGDPAQPEPQGVDGYRSLLHVMLSSVGKEDR